MIEGGGRGHGPVVTASVTIMAKPPLFKCLIGRSGANIKNIKKECRAQIDVESRAAKQRSCLKETGADLEIVDDLQHAHISGSITDVLHAAQKVIYLL